MRNETFESISVLPLPSGPETSAARTLLVIGEGSLGSEWGLLAGPPSGDSSGVSESSTFQPVCGLDTAFELELAGIWSMENGDISWKFQKLGGKAHSVVFVTIEVDGPAGAPLDA